MLLEKILALFSVLLLILCMLAPLRKSTLAQRHPLLRKIAGHHTLFGILLLIAALIHGILAGNTTGMISGKIAWMVLLILVLLSIFLKKRKSSFWNRVHTVLAMIVCVLVVIHVGYVIIV